GDHWRTDAPRQGAQNSIVTGCFGSWRWQNCGPHARPVALLGGFPGIRDLPRALLSIPGSLGRPVRRGDVVVVDPGVATESRWRAVIASVLVANTAGFQDRPAQGAVAGDRRVSG